MQKQSVWTNPPQRSALAHACVALLFPAALALPDFKHFVTNMAQLGSQQWAWPDCSAWKAQVFSEVLLLRWVD